MIFLKKLLAAGLALSLALPMAAYGGENQTYSKPITDKNKQEVGTFICSKDTEGWTKEVVLKASVVPSSGTSLSDVIYTWKNAEKTFEGSTWTVKENGTYKASAQWPAASGLTAEAVEIPVENIDNMAPEIVNILKSSESWTKESLTLTFECEDYQKADAEENLLETGDGTGDTFDKNPLYKEEKREKGSGLHPEGAYSFDNGKTWGKENAITVDKNGSIEFAVRDVLENVTKKTVTVDSIDKKAPTVRLSIADGGILYEGGSVIVTASASDGESGLAENAYSWDGGMSWSNISTLKVTQAGNYTVYVQDKAGNYVAASLKIEYGRKPSDNGGTSGSGGSGNNGSGSNGSGNGSSGSSQSGDNLVSGGGTNNVGTWDNSGNGVIYNSTSGTSNGTGENKKETTGESRESETEKRKTEKKQEIKETEREEETSSKVPVISKSDKNSGGKNRWIFVAAAIAAILCAVFAAVKIISNRTAAAGLKDDNDDTDNMENAEEAEAGGFGDTTAESAETIEIPAVKAEVEQETVETPEAEAEQGTVETPEAEAEQETVETPEAEAEQETMETPEAEAEQETVETPEAEAEQETAETPVAAEPEKEKVVLEGEHTRLIYDPETEEYKLEFK